MREETRKRSWAEVASSRPVPGQMQNNEVRCVHFSWTTSCPLCPMHSPAALLTSICAGDGLLEADFETPKKQIPVVAN